jgi:hypothetical protein
MPQKHNNPHHDTDGELAIRAEECAVGIVIHFADLSFTTVQRDAIVAFAPAFRQALYVQTEENADVDENYVNLNIADTALRAKYVSCQEHIKGEMLFLSAGTVEHLNELYDVDGGLPDNRADMLKVADIMIKGFDKMGVELPAVELIESLFTELETLRDSVKTIMDKVPDDLRESRLATYAKNTLRDQGEKLLRQVFHRAVALWSDEDNRLLELGFVPKSMIWTPGQPGGGGGGIEDTEWGGKVEGLIVELDPIGNIFIRCKKMKDAVSYKILRAVIKIGTTPPFAPFAEYKTGIPPLEDNFAYGDTDWEKGNSYFYQIVAVNAANEMSIPCDPVSVDYPL